MPPKVEEMISKLADLKKKSTRSPGEGGGGNGGETGATQEEEQHQRTVQLQQRMGLQFTPTYQHKLSTSLLSEMNKETTAVNISKYAVSEEELEATVLKVGKLSEVLPTRALRDGTWNDESRVYQKESSKRVDMAKADLSTVRTLLSVLRDKAEGMKKGSVCIHAEALFILDESKRVKYMLEKVMALARRAMVAWNDDQGDSEKLREIAAEVGELENMIADGFNFIADDSLPFYRRLQDMKVIKFLVEIMNLADERMATVIKQLVVDEVITAEIDADLEKIHNGEAPCRERASVFELVLGINVTAVQAITKLNMNNNDATYELLRRKMNDLQSFRFDFKVIGEGVRKTNNGWKKMLVQFTELYADVVRIGGELVRTCPEYKGATVMPHAFWQLLQKLGDEGSWTTGGNKEGQVYHEMVRFKLENIYAEMKTVVADISGKMMSDDQRYDRLKKKLCELDSQFIDAGKGGGSILNMNEKKQQQRTFNYKQMPGRPCGRMMRTGNCTDSSCKGVFVSKKEWDSAQVCTNQLNSGKCKFGDQCKYKHTGDKYSLKGSCVHQKKTVNAAAEIEASDSASNSKKKAAPVAPDSDSEYESE